MKSLPHSSPVREQHPLQQGLRLPFMRGINIFNASVREQHPLQQGLRHLLHEMCEQREH